MSATMPLPSLADIDAQLRGVAELRALLDGLGSIIGSMTSVLNARELALTSAREELAAHLAEIAERVAEQQRVVA